jgi:NDP-sugar pyrophosphorylase family protein
VQKRKTSRYLLFDRSLNLCGRRSGEEGKPELIRPTSQFEALAFSGVHVISPRLLTLLTEDGAFSIITSYLRLAGSGEAIQAFRADDYYWRDLGKLENLTQAGQDLRNNFR